jgi:hypothetical protein
MGESGSFLTAYTWQVVDICEYEDAGIDQTEAFCTPGASSCSYTDGNVDAGAAWAADYVGENWYTPNADPAYISSTSPNTVFVDYMSENDTSFTPPTQSPATSGYNTCSTSVPVMHAAWSGYVGSQYTNSSYCASEQACGIKILSNTFQFYQDCGRHN